MQIAEAEHWFLPKEAADLKVPWSEKNTPPFAGLWILLLWEGSERHAYQEFMNDGSFCNSNNLTRDCGNIGEKSAMRGDSVLKVFSSLAFSESQSVLSSFVKLQAFYRTKVIY